jgi:hypothetical protein
MFKPVNCWRAVFLNFSPERRNNNKCMMKKIATQNCIRYARQSASHVESGDVSRVHCTSELARMNCDTLIQNAAETLLKRYSTI